MAATLSVQDDFGQVTDANAYITLVYFKAYADQQGFVYGSDDQKIIIAILQARKYMDVRWKYFGMRKQILQTTEWPRYSISDVDRNPVNIIPQNVKDANAEYAMIYLAQGYLERNPTRDESGSNVVSKTTQVGPILDSVRFASAGNYVRPKYPIPDGLLKSRGYVMTGNQLIRG